MEKIFIKEKLRESLFSRLKEVNNEPEGEEQAQGDGHSENSDRGEKKKVQTLTKKIKNATQGPSKLLKLSQVMDAAGIGDADNATDRSAIGKAVSGKPDADGNIRHLTVQQANAMGKVVDNPMAYK
jgi:hypothetical protein